MLVGDALFVRAPLSDYLRRQDEALRPFVEKRLMSNAEGEVGALIEAVYREAMIEPLAVAFDQVQKDAQSAKVSMNDYGRRVEFDGVRVTRTYPFTGEADLFQCQPNTFSSVIPYGLIREKSVTVGLQGRNDPDALRAELDRQEQILKEYVGWQRPTVEAHNQALKNKIADIVERRRKHLKDIDNLKDLI